MTAIGSLISNFLHGEISQQSVEAAVVQAFVSGAIDQTEKEQNLGRLNAAVVVLASLSLIKRLSNVRALEAHRWPDAYGLRLAESIRTMVKDFFPTPEATEEAWIEKKLKELRVSTRRD